MSSQTVCCGCNIFKMAKIITGIEIGLSFILFLIFGYLLAISNSATFYIAITLGPFVIYWAYLATEFIGIHKKIRGLIIFSCVIRVILSVLDGAAIMAILCLAVHWSSNFASRDGEVLVAYIIIFLLATVPAMIYLIFRTWIQFKVFYAKCDNATLNNSVELQTLSPSYISII